MIGAVKNDTVKTIQNSSMTRNQFPVIFNIMITFDRRCRQIADLGNCAADCTDHCIRNDTRPLQFSPSGSQLMHKAHQSGLRLQIPPIPPSTDFFRTQNRSHLMLSDEHAYTVCTCIASPRTDKHKPYGKHSSRKHSCKVNVRQHYRYIKYSEKLPP